ncbi:MAG: LysR family transcriptional regulator [Candidatus Sericytochromatia bacterium]
MELRQLSTFKAVAEAMSFTRAAEALNYAQSSVTAHVHALEEELGVPLFERLGRRIVLTKAGERLLEYADKLLRLAGEAQSVVPAGDEPAGSLVIGAPESLLTYRMLPVLRGFRARCPRVKVVFRPGTCLELRRALSAGTLDVAVLLEEPVEAPGLVVEELFPESLELIAHPEHRLAGVPMGPRDLEGEALLMPEAGCSYRVMLESRLAEAGVHPGSITEFASLEAIKQCVMAGLGVGILPEVAVSGEVATGRMVILPWHDLPFGFVTQVAWHKDKWMTPALLAFIEVLNEILPKQAAA